MKSTPKAHPMIFNADMVRALLEGRKTQTRRIVSEKHLPFFELSAADQIGQWLDRPMPISIGDLIYVRETWSDVSSCGAPSIAYRADSDIRDLVLERSFLEDGAFNYDDPRCAKYSFENWADDLFSGVEGRWRPSVQMPRWASRLTLKVTGVRVERLVNISEKDAISEGIEKQEGTAHWKQYDPSSTWRYWESAVQSFRTLWFAIYGEESWNRNDRVWVIEFEVIRQNVDDYLAEA